MVDALSRYIYVEPVRNKTADMVLKGMQEFVRRAGIAPARLTVDAGSEFVNYKMRQYLKREGVQIQIIRAPLET